MDLIRAISGAVPSGRRGQQSRIKLLQISCSSDGRFWGKNHKTKLNSSKTALSVESVLGSPSFNLPAPAILNSPQHKVNNSKWVFVWKTDFLSFISPLISSEWCNVIMAYRNCKSCFHPSTHTASRGGTGVPPVHRSPWVHEESSVAPCYNLEAEKWRCSDLWGFTLQSSAKARKAILAFGVLGRFWSTEPSCTPGPYSSFSRMQYCSGNLSEKGFLHNHFSELRYRKLFHCSRNSPFLQ